MGVDFRCHQDNFCKSSTVEEKGVCRQIVVRQLLELRHSHCSLQIVGPALSGLVERCTNVVGVFTGVVTLIVVSLVL